MKPSTCEQTIQDRPHTPPSGGDSPAHFAFPIDFLCGLAEAPADGQTGREARLLAHRFAQLEGAEQRRLARELHDALGQSFTLLKLLLHRAGSTAAGPSPALTDAGKVVDETLTWVRGLLGDLQFDIVSEGGLVQALRRHIDCYTGRTQVRVDFEYEDVPAELAEQSALAVYRVVQESLANVARHAGVAEARVHLWSASGALWLQVSDQGKGFLPATENTTHGLGRVRERVELLGGEFRVGSRPGAGTRVMARLPI